jgi:acetylornithine/succinyldiaminopimelate/putrescine aminotransferase
VPFQNTNKIAGSVRFLHRANLSKHRNCARYGILFIVDEVQAGMYRTTRFLASHHYSVEPEMAILRKALSGGSIPCSAVLMWDRVYEAVFNSLKQSIVHTSTFSENSMLMRGQENLGQRALVTGDVLREWLRERLGVRDGAGGARDGDAFTHRVPGTETV